MKLWKRKSLLWAAVALAAVCALAGCQKEAPQVNGPEFPLEDQVLTDTLEQVGLSWVIDEEETQSSSEDSVLHSLRDPEKGYPNGGPNSRLLYAGVTSSVFDGERVLGLTLLPESAAGFDWEESRPFDWANWEKQFQLAALLYGFEDENELYNAVSAEEVGEEPFSWEKQLSGGYCRVRVRQMGRPSLPDGARSVDITIYQSKELCEDLDEQIKQARQEALKKEKEAGVNSAG